MRVIPGQNVRASTTLEWRKRGLEQVFGSVPILVYIIARALPVDPSPDSLFAVSAVATSCTMFALGVVKASFTKQNKLHSGAMMLVNGSLAAAAAYGIGYTLENILHI